MTTIQDYRSEDVCKKLKATCIDAFVSLGYDEENPTYLRLDSPWNWCSVDLTPVVERSMGGVDARLSSLEKRVSALEQNKDLSEQADWLQADTSKISYIKNKPTDMTEWTHTSTDPGTGSSLAEGNFVVVV